MSGARFPTKVPMQGTSSSRATRPTRLSAFIAEQVEDNQHRRSSSASLRTRLAAGCTRSNRSAVPRSESRSPHRARLFAHPTTEAKLRDSENIVRAAGLTWTESSTFPFSRKARQRKPSHFGSYCHWSPRGICSTESASIGSRGPFDFKRHPAVAGRFRNHFPGWCCKSFHGLITHASGAWFRTGEISWPMTNTRRTKPCFVRAMCRPDTLRSLHGIDLRREDQAILRL